MEIKPLSLFVITMVMLLSGCTTISPTDLQEDTVAEICGIDRADLKTFVEYDSASYNPVRSVAYYADPDAEEGLLVRTWDAQPGEFEEKEQFLMRDATYLAHNITKYRAFGRSIFSSDGPRATGREMYVSGPEGIIFLRAFRLKCAWDEQLIELASTLISLQLSVEE